MSGRLEIENKVNKATEKTLKSLPDIVTDYYDSSESGMSPKTLQAYINDIKRFVTYLKETNGNVDNEILINCSDTLIRRYLKKNETKEVNGEIVKLSYATRARLWSSLSSFYTFLKRRKEITDNPMEYIKRPPMKDSPKRVFLTEDELNKLVDVVKAKHNVNTKRDLTILYIFITTGMRVSALTEIDVKDIDFDERTLTITDKGDKCHVYPLSDFMVSVLKDYLEKRNVDFIDIDDNGILFPTKLNGTMHRMTPENVRYLIKTYSKKALGNSISPHKLRAAFCNILLKKTNDLFFVSKAVGHSKVTTTQIYLDDSTAEARTKSANIMANILN